MEIVEIVPGLFQSSAIRWSSDIKKVKALGIDVVIDLSGGIDPSMPWLKSYLYWPIKDERSLPNFGDLMLVGFWGAQMVWARGHRVLTHCTLGFNRSGLVNGVILNQHGLSGVEALRLIRVAWPGALSNETFARFIEKLPIGCR